MPHRQLHHAGGHDPIGAVLTRRAETIGDIVKVERGTWGLKEWYPNRSFKKEKDGKTTIEENAVRAISEAIASESPPEPKPFVRRV